MEKPKKKSFTRWTNNWGEEQHADRKKTVRVSNMPEQNAINFHSKSPIAVVKASKKLFSHFNNFVLNVSE